MVCIVHLNYFSCCTCIVLSILNYFSCCTNFLLFPSFIQIKKMPYKHTCPSTSKLEQNCMATNAWVKDRVTEKLRKDPTNGAATLKKWLEEKYCIKLSYYVVWDGRQMTLDDILGSWEDSFDHAFSFKAELESKCPGSVVEV